MRIIFPALLMLMCSTIHAQWSVLEGDPRLATQKDDWNLYQPFTRDEWNASNFAKPEDMKWFNDARYGMFIHFGLNSYVNKDMSWPIVYNRKAPDNGHGAYPDSAWQKVWPSLFKLERFNADKWVQTAKDAGMKYITVIAKHHDGFHMWDTKYSDFKITNTPFKRDYLKEIIDACHRAKMPVGIYYSQRDWYHPDYAPIDTNLIKRISAPPFFEALPGKKIAKGPTHKKYIEYQFNVVEELLTKYGKIDIFWFDAVWYGNMFTADMWDAEKLTRMIRKLQPGIIINNRTSLPGDFDTPEQRVGMYQQRPWESAMTLNGSWGFDPSHKVYPVKDLVKQMLMTAAGNGNMLLSWGARFNGEWDKAQKDTLLKIGKWLKKYGNAYYGTQGGPWMPASAYGTVHRDNRVYIYVFEWKQEGLILPLLKNNKIIKAAFLNIPERLDWKKNTTNYQFSKPSSAGAIVTIIELTMEKPVKETDVSAPQDTRDEFAYGEVIVTKDIGPGDWNDNQMIIDLEKPKNVTRIGLFNNNSKIDIQGSLNANEWEDIGVATGEKQEFGITTFMTGVEVPGKNLRYIRLRNNGKREAVNLKVFAK